MYDEDERQAIAPAETEPSHGADTAPGAPGARIRPPMRPPIGIPLPRQQTLRGAVASVLIHAIIVALIVSPFMVKPLMDATEGAGGPGPAGGGGGGRGGTGGRTTAEQLQYLQVVPPAPAPAVIAPVVPPIIPPIVPPVVPPVVPPPVTPPVVAPPTAQALPAAVAPADVAPTAGTGGGSGTDGTSGNGPGSGGGLGTGVGTGTGSANGPGTGGGPGTVYPPTPIFAPIPPLPAPERIKPYHGVATFDVDSTGRVIAFELVQPSKDRGYNNRVKQMLAELRFRPGVRASDGVPVRSTGRVEFDVY